MKKHTTDEITVTLYDWRDLLRLLRPLCWLWLGLAFASFVTGLLS
jgi:hypothetical protein